MLSMCSGRSTAASNTTPMSNMCVVESGRKSSRRKCDRCGVPKVFVCDMWLDLWHQPQKGSPGKTHVLGRNH